MGGVEEFIQLRVKLYKMHTHDDGSLVYTDCSSHFFIKRVVMNEQDAGEELQCLRTLESLFERCDGDDAIVDRLVTECSDNCNNGQACEMTSHPSTHVDEVAEHGTKGASNNIYPTKCDLSSDPINYTGNCIDIGSDTKDEGSDVITMYSEEREGCDLRVIDAVIMKETSETDTETRRMKFCVDETSRLLIKTKIDVCKCDCCDAFFPSVQTLDSHYEEKFGNILKPFRCDSCDAAFSHHSLVKVHQQKVHESSEVDKVAYIRVCLKCGNTLKSPLEWYKHKPECNKSILSSCFKCDLCQTAFTTLRLLQRHYITMHSHESFLFTCGICAEEFKSSDNFMQHTLCHSRKLTKFQCGICNETFQSYYRMTRHFYTHTKQLPFICRQCNAGFNTLTTAVNHAKFTCAMAKNTTPGKQPVPCQTCGALLLQKNLKKHCNLMHLKKQRYFCKRCPASFYYASQLHDHSSVHGLLKRHICEMCGKDFSSRSVLKKHRFVHSDVRPFRCESCERTFKSEAILRKHTQLHTSVRDFQCEICAATFKRSGDLRQHHRTHTSDRKHKCNECGKTFLRLYNLKVHTRCHSGEKPYKCGVCPKVFTQLAGLKSHRCDEKGS